MPFKLPNLPYATSALAPIIDEQTMELHHGKHHAAYTKKLNDVLRGTEWEDKVIDEILESLGDLPADIQTSVRNNGGGFYNHRLFWSIMTPTSEAGGVMHSGDVEDAIDRDFGSLDDFKQKFKEKATGQFGSGWAWLVVNPDQTLEITSTANQDTPFMAEEFGGLGGSYRPILGLDVWEHAYYLNYQNRRPEYVDAWWDVVDWHAVEGKLHDIINIEH